MREIRRTVGALSVCAFCPDTQSAASSGVETVMYLHAQADTARALYASIAGKSVALVAIDGEDWNRDLSPWEAKKVFKAGDDFAGGADAHLQTITQHVVPEIERAMAVTPRSRALVGYSLAGLFAVYALYRTDVFTAAASVSGSLWYDGFVDFLRETTPIRVPEKLYLSLGDREKYTKNERMARVEACTEETAAHFAQLGAQVRWEKNPGNHFADSEERLKKAMAFLTGQETER